MYGLLQAGIMFHNLLGEFLSKEAYYQTPHTPGLWCHNWCLITFALVIDNFLIRYVGKDHTLYVENALKKHYEEVSTNWGTIFFCSIHLKWDYKLYTVQPSIPGYNTAVIHKLSHNQSETEHSPHLIKRITYGTKLKLMSISTSDPLDNKGTKSLQ